MKKITLLIVAFVFCSISVAQNVIIDRPANNVNSLIATQGNDGTGVYCADQFELTADETFGTLEVFGTNSNGSTLGALLTSFNVIIYDDASGVPAGFPDLSGTGAVELRNIDLAFVTQAEDGAGGSNFLINLTAANGGNEILLPAGTYWMVAFPSVDSATGDAGRWNWGLSDATPAVEPVLIDPQDLFGANATDWSNIATLIGAAASGLAWQVTDEIILNVDNEELSLVSVFPNPANEILNIRVPSSVELTGVALYDVLGKRVSVSLIDSQINVSDLARGVYILNIETNSGSLTQKVVIE